MTTAEQLADEIYGLHCDIGRLEQENARLHELMYNRAHDWAIQHMTEDELRIIATNMMAENAELREMVHILAYCMSEDRDCDKCVFNGADMPILHISACDSLPNRMRELGVGVSK